MLWARPQHAGRVSRRSRIHKADSRSWHSMNMQMAECGCVRADLQQMAWLAAYSLCALNLHLAHFKTSNAKWQQAEVSAFNTPCKHRREVVLRLHTVCCLALHADGSGGKIHSPAALPSGRGSHAHRGSESTFYPMLSYFRKSIAVFKVPRLRPFVLLLRELVEWHWQGRTEALGEKPVTVPLCIPQIPHGLTWYWTRVYAVTGRRLNTRINMNCTYRPSPYRAGNTLRLGYKNQSFNVV